MLKTEIFIEPLLKFFNKGLEAVRFCFLFFKEINTFYSAKAHYIKKWSSDQKWH